MAPSLRLLDRMVFQPTPGIDVLPEELGLNAEQLFLEAGEVHIHAFFLPHADADRAVLFLHGNAGNASHRLPNAGELAELGAHVLLPDYRGYGRSEGVPTEAGVYQDARAAFSYLTQTRGIPASRIVIFGRSLGGAVAIDLAAEHKVAGLILESTFPSLSAIARSMLGYGFGPLLAGRFDSEAKIAKVDCPLLFFHGNRDTLIPMGLGQQLFEVAKEPKSFEVIHGAGHNDTTIVGGAAYFERIRRFLDEAVPH